MKKVAKKLPLKLEKPELARYAGFKHANFLNSFKATFFIRNFFQGALISHSTI